MGKIKHDVLVRKANIPLKSGESIRDFTTALSDAGRVTLVQKLNLDVKKTSVFMLEAYSTGAVFEVYKYESTSQKDRMQFWGMTYKRDEKGDFTFETVKEVQRVVRFEEKTQVTKSLFSGVV